MVTYGRPVHKSKIIPTVNVSFPQSDHKRADGSNESIFALAGNVNVKFGSETIDYTTKRPTERYKPNACRHLREMHYYSGNPTAPQFISFSEQAGHSGHYCDYYYGHSHAVSAHAIAVGTAYGPTKLNVASPPVYPGSPQADFDLAWVKMQPDLTALSVPNFFLELDDVGKLFKLWKRNLSLAKNVAGAHLNYKFGWAPTLGDIRSMVGVIQGVMDKLKAFEDAVNTRSKGHLQVSKEVVAKDGTFNYGGNSSNPCEWSGIVTRVKSAGCVYRIDPFPVTGHYERILRVYLDALGFELNPRILWEATPFTFVLDWFFGIGSWLDSHKHDTLHIPVTLLGGYTQVKEVVNVNSRLRLGVNDPNQTETAWPPCSTTRSFFGRHVVEPSADVFVGLGWKVPTFSQATLLVSLGTVLKRT
jgi:hypothetical protein